MIHKMKIMKKNKKIILHQKVFKWSENYKILHKELINNLKIKKI